MRQVGFGRDARDIERGDRRANRVECAARHLDERFVLLRLRPQRADGGVGRLDVAPQSFEPEHVGVELRFARDDGRTDLPHAAARLGQLRGERGRAPFELARGFLEPLHFDAERRGAFDERGMGRAGVSRAAAQVVARLARLEQTTLRDGEPFVGAALVIFEPPDRRARFFLPAIEAVALLAGLIALARQLLAFLRQARVFLGGALQLQVVADHGLLLLVVLGVERGDGVRRMRDRAFEAGRLFGELDERVAFGGNPAAQFLDFTLGLENAARVVARSARHQMRPAKQVALARGHRQPRRAAGRGGARI